MFIPASTSAMLSQMFFDPGYTITWTLINIVLPLFPVVLGMYMNYLLSTGERWYIVIKQGELYVISITLAATTLSYVGIQSMAAYFLLVLIIICAGMYGICTYIKKTNPTLDPKKEREFCMLSVNLTTLTILFCYILTNFGKLN